MNTFKQFNKSRNMNSNSVLRDSIKRFKEGEYHGLIS